MLGIGFLLCEVLGNGAMALASMVPGSQCSNLVSQESTAKHGTIDCRYTEHAVRCFELIQELLQGKLDGKVLIQVLVPSRGEAAVFAGLSGMIKTANLENRSVVGQVSGRPESGIDEPKEEDAGADESPATASEERDCDRIHPRRIDRVEAEGEKLVEERVHLEDLEEREMKEAR